LPDWRALNRCASLFGDQQSLPKGRYLSGPWLARESARIRALGLNFDKVKLASSDAIVEKLQLAIQHKKPIVLFNWSPNWTDLHIKGEFVEFPAYDPQCETNPQWGINPRWLWDCGNPINYPLTKIVSKQLPAFSPCAFSIVQKISFISRDISQVALWIDIEKMSHQAAAKRWIEQNTHRWQTWLDLPTLCSSPTKNTANN